MNWTSIVIINHEGCRAFVPKLYHVVSFCKLLLVLFAVRLKECLDENPEAGLKSMKQILDCKAIQADCWHTFFFVSQVIFKNIFEYYSRMFLQYLCNTLNSWPLTGSGSGRWIWLYWKEGGSSAHAESSGWTGPGNMQVRLSFLKIDGGWWFFHILSKQACKLQAMPASVWNYDSLTDFTDGGEV